MASVRTVLASTALFVCFTSQSLTQHGAHETVVDLNGDGRSEKVSYDTSGLAVYDSQGKLALVQSDVPDLRPMKSQELISSREVTWQTWNWGRASAVVISEMTCGNHCYVEGWVVYQGPRDVPVLQKVAEYSKGVELRDAEGDGITDLIVSDEEILDPSLLLEKTGSASGAGIQQQCVSMADKVAVPYLYAFSTIGDEFILYPIGLASERFRRSEALVSEWVTELSVLVQKMKAQYRREMRGRVLASSAAIQCDKEIKDIEVIIARLLD